MALIDTTTWTQTPSGWTFSGTDATFGVLGVGYLEGPRTEPTIERVVSVYATVENTGAGGKGYIIITLYDSGGLPIGTAASLPVSTGVAAVSTVIHPTVLNYSISLVVITGNAGDDIPRPVTFKSVSLGKAPLGGAAPGQVVTEGGRVVSQGPAKSTNVKPSIPQSQHRLIVGEKIDKNWYQYFQSLGDAVPSQAEIEVQATAAVAAIPETELNLRGLDGISVQGNATDGYFVKLNALLDSGVGEAIWRFTRDAFGRVEGTQAATTDHLPEGLLNFYFTDDRAQDAIGAALAAGTQDGLTVTYDDAGNKIDAANTDKGSVAVAAHVALADPHPQYLTAAEGDAAADARIAAASIDALADVTITAPVAGQALVRNAGNTAWVNGTVASGGANFPAVMARLSLGF